MKDFKKLAARESIDRTIAALGQNGIEARFADSKAAAVQMVLDLIPKGAEVFTAASITLDELGLSQVLNEPGKYDGVKARLSSMDPKTQGREMRKLGAAPDVAIGSAHAVTETGAVLVASLTGSQLPAYAYGAGTIIWIVSSKKIVKDLEEGLKRVNEHVVPLESARARKAYGLPDSFSSFPAKILVFNREVQSGRAKMLIVDDDLGF